ncbi:MAG TPA: 2-amino-3,7-dideoxy-D-threo-hept-6-ulosonate synthase [Candidatus Dormibacteraeota bacterium]|nr:2-amino-3,7-dideoxy-D-threo-hept-6-ulosonate synthase [Candidatus Dormibacteraeota bacterium]
MESGKTRRLRRIFRDDGRTVMIPMDHGVSIGPVHGLEDMTRIVEDVSHGEADAVLVHAGIAKTVDTRRLGLVMHLSGATRLTNDPLWKTQVSTIKEAVRLGADAVSVHINVGSQREQDMLDRFSLVIEQCDDYGMPTLAMMYPRGPGIQNEHAFDVVSHAARLGYEVGADIVKTNYTGDIDSFRKVVEAVKVPVLIAGGPKASNEREALQMIQDSIKAGAAGVSIGRNVFQHDDPTRMTMALVDIVHHGASASQALAILGEKTERLLATT